MTEVPEGPHIDDVQPDAVLDVQEAAQRAAESQAKEAEDYASQSKATPKQKKERRSRPSSSAHADGEMGAMCPAIEPKVAVPRPPPKVASSSTGSAASSSSVGVVAPKVTIPRPPPKVAGSSPTGAAASSSSVGPLMLAPDGAMAQSLGKAMAATPSRPSDIADNLDMDAPLVSLARVGTGKAGKAKVGKCKAASVKSAAKIAAKTPVQRPRQTLGHEERPLPKMPSLASLRPPPVKGLAKAKEGSSADGVPFVKKASAKATKGSMPTMMPKAKAVATGGGNCAMGKGRGAGALGVGRGHRHPINCCPHVLKRKAKKEIKLCRDTLK